MCEANVHGGNLPKIGFSYLPSPCSCFLPSHIPDNGKGNWGKEKLGEWFPPSTTGCRVLARCCCGSKSCDFRNDLEQWEVVESSSVAVTTAGDPRTSVCRVVIYLQRDMSEDSSLPQHHVQSFSTRPPPPLSCPKTKICSYRGAMGLGNKYVRLNVGGNLFYTTLQVLTRENSLLKAMFSGKKEVFTDKEGTFSLQWLTLLRWHHWFNSCREWCLSYDVDVQNTRTGNVDLNHIILNMPIPSKESRRFHEASLCLRHYKIAVWTHLG